MTDTRSPQAETIEASCPEHGPFVRFRGRHGLVGQCPECKRLADEKREAEASERMRVQRIERLLEKAWLPPRFAGKGLDRYRPQNHDQRDALQACLNYVVEIDKHINAGSCLAVIGPPGVGKTHLLAAIVADACLAGYEARYTTMVSFLAAVKGSWAWNGAEFGGGFLEPSLLVLDEIWIPQTGRDRESLLALLDERYRNGDPTLIGSNLTWPQMQQELGLRFCDRLLEDGGQVLAVDGVSMRGVSPAPEAGASP